MLIKCKSPEVSNPTNALYICMHGNKINNKSIYKIQSVDINNFWRTNYKYVNCFR